MILMAQTQIPVKTRTHTPNTIAGPGWVDVNAHFNVMKSKIADANDTVLNTVQKGVDTQDVVGQFRRYRPRTRKLPLLGPTLHTPAPTRPPNLLTPLTPTIRLYTILSLDTQ